jgi:hypothetical protein
MISHNHRQPNPRQTLPPTRPLVARNSRITSALYSVGVSDIGIPFAVRSTLSSVARGRSGRG